MSIIYKNSPSEKIDINLNLSHALVKPKSVDLPLLDQKIYKFWHKQWSETFKSINYFSHLYSDDYYRQYEASALLYEDEVIATVMFDWFDLTNESHLEHSYFKHHSLEAIQKYRNLGIKKSLVISYLAIDPLWRKNFNIAHLIIGLCTKRFQLSSFEHMITYSRNNRRTNDLIYQFGAVPTLTNVEVRNEPSDFVYFTKDSTKVMSTHALNNQIENLWLKRIQDPAIQIYEPKINQTKGEISEQSNL